MTVHTSAVIDPAARLAADVEIGPYCVIGSDVTLACGVKLHSHVAIDGVTTIGANTIVFPFASLGHAPQDLKWKGERTTLVIGSDCIIREGVTVNPGTAQGGAETKIGDRCVLLAASHVGHDCHVGDDVVLSNNVMLAGHVRVGNRAILGGGVGVHQFVRIGQGAFVGGLSGLEGDLIPFGLALGNRARFAGLNLVGLRRQRIPRQSIDALKRAVAVLYESASTRDHKIASIAGDSDDPCVAALLSFLRAPSARALCEVDDRQRRKRGAT